MMGNTRLRSSPSTGEASDAAAEAIVEQLPDALLVIDHDNGIRFANAAAERLFGRSRNELVGMPFGQPIVDDGYAEIEIVRPGRPLAFVEIRTANIRWHEIDARLIALRDVTDRKRMEERLRELERDRAKAEVANRTKSSFLAVMSHELRTPLNAIVGYADLLMIGVEGSLSGKQAEFVTRLRQSGLHLLGLVNDVLDLAKLDAGRLSIDQGTGIVDRVVEGALEIIRPAAAARAIELEASWPEGETVFRGDESRVRQILVNLLQNAVKFTPPGGRIEVRCGITDSPAAEARVARGLAYGFVEVHDTGIGIAGDKLAAVFDPFVRVETGHVRQTDGSGLGLAISRRLARLMEGDLTVDSELGRGSTFTLWIPLAVPVAASLQRRGETPVDEDGVQETSARRGILIDAGEAIMRDSVPIVAALVVRNRHERDIPNAESLRYSEIANHFVSFLSVLGETMVGMAEQTPATARGVEEGIEMLRLLAERHGRQRARLGWSTAVVEREWRVMQDEIERALLERLSHRPPSAIEEPRSIAQRLILDAEARSREALRAAARD